MQSTDTKNEIAVFAGGCFWCTEAVFRELKGVSRVTSGYAGGDMKNPNYEAVSSGRTGHAEVVKIEFDPSGIPYKDLLEIFFATHDPTTRNRQGADVGTQYRSMIFYTSDKQKKVAEEYIKELATSDKYKSSIVTELQQFDQFYPAEDYHQDYYAQNSQAPYCQLMISPKIEKLRKEYKNAVK